MRSARPPGKSPPAGPRSAGAKSGARRGPARAASGLRAPSPQLVGFPPSALPPEGPRRHLVRASEGPPPLLPGRSSGADLAMAGARGLLHLWLSCLCVSLAQGQRLRQPFPELRVAVPADRAAGGGPESPLQPLDQLSEHMLRLYDRYSGGRAEEAPTPGNSERGSPSLRPQPLREGNTVRSFRAGAAGECRGAPFPRSRPRGLPGHPRGFLVCPPRYLETLPRPAAHPPRSPSVPSHPAFHP